MNCEACSDTGLVEILVDGCRRAKRCPDCAAPDFNARLEIPARYAACSFELYRPEGILQKTALEGCKNFVLSWYRGSGLGLYLCGPVGRGKTGLAVATLVALAAKHGASGLFVDFTALLTLLRSTYQETAKISETEIFGKLLGVDVLLIDDLGTEKQSDWTGNVLYYIINNRYSRKASLIVTSNSYLNYTKENKTVLSVENQMDGRIVSRLSEMCREVRVEGGRDRRKEH